MHASDSMGQLAGALARAQVELTNPQKTLTATLPLEAAGKGGAGGRPQTYRYAPLSAGLDIIRRALGQQEIAVLQTTQVEQGHGEQGHGSEKGELLVLTTSLVHASGEWVATTWPVCRLTDVSDPKLLGAALTYARRYSLFALVGITGDDDLDAPDLTGGARNAREAAAEAKQQRGSPTLHHSPRAYGRARREHPLSRVRGAVRPMPSRSQASPQTTSLEAGTDQKEALPSASELIGSLKAVQDEETLLRWTTHALPARAELDEPTRAALDEAFLRRAHAIEADPELLIAFGPAHEEHGQEALPSPAPAPPGGHDAQAL